MSDFYASAALLNAVRVIKVKAEEDGKGLEAIAVHEAKALDAIQDSRVKLKTAGLIISLIGGNESRVAFFKAEKALNDGVLDILKVDAKPMENALAFVDAEAASMVSAMRKDLGLQE